MRKGKECFYDIYRAKLIPVTPEEVVRQKIAHWCVKKMQVPPQVIILEQHLSHYQIPSRDRADIIIHEETETGLLPLAVIECKATSVALCEKTFHQCFSYSELLQTEYAIITNGVELLAYKYNQNLAYHITLNGHDVLVLDYWHPANQYPDIMNYYGLMSIYQQALKNKGCN